MKVAIYVRVSTDEQAEEGYSIKAQADSSKDFAKSQGWTVTHTYIDDGYSAKNLDRPQIQKLIKAVKEKQFDVVLVYRLDRLVRSVLDLHELLQLFDKNNVMFKSATEPFDTTSAMGRFFITLVGAMAAWERENLAERVKMGMKRMVSEGKRAGGKPPYGYNQEGERLTPNPREVPVLKRVYEEFINGKAVRTICADLNREGIPTSNGAKWSGKPLYYILRNPIYIGKVRWDGNTYEGQHEPILSLDTFEKAQKEYKRRRGQAPRFVSGIYPFSGLLVCGHCGQTMVIRHQPHWGKTVYVCKTRGCIQVQITLETLEDLFLREVKTISDRSYWEKKTDLQDLTDEQKQINEIKRELRSIQQKKRKWLDAFENDAIDLDTLRGRTEALNIREYELKGQKENLENSIKELIYTPDDLILEQFNNIRGIWEVSSEEERKQLLTLFFERIELHLLPKYHIERIGSSIKGLRDPIKHSLIIVPKYM